MEYKFLGYETAGDVKPLADCGYKLDSLLDLYDVLSDGVKTLGQCSITAFLVQDIFGGEVYGIKRPDGSFHCYNVIGGKQYDLTIEQFGDERDDLVYDNKHPQLRAVHFKKEEKYNRYLLLKSLLKGVRGA